MGGNGTVGNTVGDWQIQPPPAPPRPCYPGWSSGSLHLAMNANAFPGKEGVGAQMRDSVFLPDMDG